MVGSNGSTVASMLAYGPGGHGFDFVSMQIKKFYLSSEINQVKISPARVKAASVILITLSIEC